MKERMMNKQAKQTQDESVCKARLTQGLALEIARMVQQFPEKKIEVTWWNVIEQVKQRYGLKFHRDTLARKEWNGQKFISIAFADALAVQERLVKDNVQKYVDDSPFRRRLMLAKLLSENRFLRSRLRGKGNINRGATDE
jgi:hypothetical protein